MHHKHKPKVTSVLKTILVDLQTDEEWTNFIVDQIVCNLDVISNPDKLNDLLSDDLLDFLPPQTTSSSVCVSLFRELKKEGVILKDYIQEEDEKKTES